MNLAPVQIGDQTLEAPIIQGGMGIGVSLSRLAGNVAKNGGMGILSCAQIGFQHPLFERAPFKANMAAIADEFNKAKALAEGHGIVGFNIMCATFKYEKYVKRAVEVGADVIISGAGLPMKLPEYVAGSNTKIAPIVSSAKAAKVILRNWAKHYQRTADFVVIEGPRAGGHLGFKYDDVQMPQATFDEEVLRIIQMVQSYGEQFSTQIPVFMAGGVYDKRDIDHYIGLGCAGVQMATRFVVTEECDAPASYKQRYLDAKEEDVEVIKSPVGMPGRAIHNHFTEEIKERQIPIAKCRSCLSYDHCDRKTIPYCITEMLLNAVTEKPDDGLVFAGANVYRIDKLTTVKELMDELTVDPTEKQS